MTERKVIRFHYKEHKRDLARLKVCAAALAGYLESVHDVATVISVTAEGVFEVTVTKKRFTPFSVAPPADLRSVVADFIGGFLEDEDVIS